MDDSVVFTFKFVLKIGLSHDIFIPPQSPDSGPTEAACFLYTVMRTEAFCIMIYRRAH